MFIKILLFLFSFSAFSSYVIVIEEENNNMLALEDNQEEWKKHGKIHNFTFVYRGYTGTLAKSRLLIDELCDQICLRKISWEERKKNASLIRTPQNIIDDSNQASAHNNKSLQRIITDNIKLSSKNIISINNILLFNNDASFTNLLFEHFYLLTDYINTNKSQKKQLITEEFIKEFVANFSQQNHGDKIADFDNTELIRASMILYINKNISKKIINTKHATVIFSLLVKISKYFTKTQKNYFLEDKNKSDTANLYNIFSNASHEIINDLTKKDYLLIDKNGIISIENPFEHLSPELITSLSILGIYNNFSDLNLSFILLNNKKFMLAHDEKSDFIMGHHNIIHFEEAHIPSVAQETKFNLKDENKVKIIEEFNLKSEIIKYNSEENLSFDHDSKSKIKDYKYRNRKNQSNKKQIKSSNNIKNCNYSQNIIKNEILHIIKFNHNEKLLNKHDYYSYCGKIVKYFKKKNFDFKATINGSHIVYHLEYGIARQIIKHGPSAKKIYSRYVEEFVTEWIIGAGLK